MAVNNYRKISEGRLMKGWRKHEDAGEKEGKRRQGWRGAVSGLWKGSVSPADIVSTPLTSKGWDYGESEGLQTMGGEENNIKVSRTFESG